MTSYKYCNGISRFVKSSFCNCNKNECKFPGLAIINLLSKCKYAKYEYVKYIKKKNYLYNAFRN